MNYCYFFFKNLLLYTTRINMQTQYRQIYVQMQADSVVQIRRHLLTSVLRHEERDTSLKSLSLSYYVNNTPNVRHISWCFRFQFIFAGWDQKNVTAAATAKNSTVCFHGPMSTFNSMVGLLNTMVGPQLLNTMVGPQLTWFFKSLNLSPSLLDKTSSTLQLHFLSWVYYDNGDCHILCARKLHQLTTHLNS